MWKHKSVQPMPVEELGAEDSLILYCLLPGSSSGAGGCGERRGKAQLGLHLLPSGSHSLRVIYIFILCIYIFSTNLCAYVFVFIHTCIHT